MDERVMQFRVGVMFLATLLITGILLVMFGKLPKLIGHYYVQVRFDGDREFSNGALVNDFAGTGLGNSAFKLGDWTWGKEDRPFSYVRTNTLPSPGWTGTPPTP